MNGEEVYKLKVENANLKAELKEAANELCLQCGQYRDEHLGACDHCKWRPVRHGEIP
mgnify:CR=1 FL=1